ncbi:hypothetical protein NAEGRDRAFT_58721 [Naegleria gruberi]|uniref:Uncharacterized protein n=1 Tax=Naegleria gruberi TaxID=5762 RepID=D2VN15_NAEGR|nr:uncharacterized protein NAEGRDRAFT_58721 [Naegleria gruberi]EFC41916.1 hypothetical protein NAEGRDRAFT_58721 [Naegleria gruberi]|eukprot:XP_002674660.1 hypothetical protein NAEGRDRAFT_58721 [Naegleria gruberi strain NEG-M]
MGCDQSKQQDVNSTKTREKTVPSSSGGNNSGGATTTNTTNNNGNQNNIHSNPLLTKPHLVEGEDGAVAKSVAESWTDLRMKEREMFDKILNKTGKKFIYVSSSPSLLVGGGDLNYENNYGEEDEPENEERMKTVETILKQSNLFTLPTSNIIENQSVIEQLIKDCSNNDETNSRTPDDEDIQLIKRITDLTINSVKNIKIDSKSVGELVVQLPTLGVESE